MLALLSGKRVALPVAALAVVSVSSGGCESPRSRPTAAGSPLPATSVAVASPVTEALVPSDSVVRVVVGATGLLQAVEYFLVRSAVRDTLGWDRQEFTQPQDSVRVVFQVPIPDLKTGTQLEIRAVAENVIGERELSAPVYVLVIECDLYPLACAGL